MAITKYEYIQLGGSQVSVAVTDDNPPRYLLASDLVVSGGGDATAAKQDTGNTSLASIDTKLTSPVAVKGTKQSVSFEFTRPADTTAYAALDVVGVNLAVTGATNASPIVITSATHSLADGDPVTIASVGGNTNANGDFFAKVTGYSSTTFGLFSDAALTTPVAGNSNYTSDGTVARCWKVSGLARLAAGSGYVVKAQILTSQKTCVARFKLHVFNQPVTAYVDNNPYLKLYANRAKRVGEIIFPASATEDGTNSTSAGAMLVPGSGNLPLGFVCNTSDTALYFKVQTLDVFTPDSAQTFFIKFLVEDD